MSNVISGETGEGVHSTDGDNSILHLHIFFTFSG
jgi:hypothetical protein